MSLRGVGTSLTWNLICIREKHPISLLDQRAASEGISELLAWDWSMAIPGSSSSLGTPQLSTARGPAEDLPWSRCLIIYEHPDHLLARVSADLDWRKAPLSQVAGLLGELAEDRITVVGLLVGVCAIHRLWCLLHQTLWQRRKRSSVRSGCLQSFPRQGNRALFPALGRKKKRREDTIPLSPAEVKGMREAIWTKQKKTSYEIH